ncbi:MAG TPA: amylo-alpha-1,6-glucosidase [Candidatus Sulfotelmatobacter sp.]|jgi:starch synthase (maltosyl-transferring)|nr:amylo-alpha-1,6-glucosidase [Candidatus Sulfotelmatobacter sp.]
MFPAPGERLLRFVGDKALFQLRTPDFSAPKNWQARLRTNLGRAAQRRAEILAAHAGGPVVANSSWRDIPMQRTADGWQIELPLAEPGFFKAKAYLLDEKNWQHWPDGNDVGLSVHPNFARTANTIYCAFTRLFGATKNLATTADVNLEAQLESLEAQGYATLPPSGKFRDLVQQLPFIVNKLGCKIIHLLPVHPTPVTYARFGRFGSPYAALDLTAVDPALVEFDKRTTGIDQFCELTQAAHSLDARVFIDIVINHTGWGSTLQENYPQFFLKTPDGEFASPGAWGTVWEDLVELEQHDVKLWDLIADALVIWCRRGVDGFRCDAGYKIPVPAWQYIIARIQEEFPETIFLLEGLGGPWETTESLLTDGGMQWAYSELFQNYSGKEVAWYLDYASLQNSRVGSYVNYSETHDNDRLAKKGRVWSLLRNRLCALTSPCGGFAFTCGVEWLAAEKIRVHGNTGLNWDSPDNIVPELAQLNGIISNHPCFFDGAKSTRLSAPDSPVFAQLRESAEGKDFVLILANCDTENQNVISLAQAKAGIRLTDLSFNLAGPTLPHLEIENDFEFVLPPGTVFCLAPTEKPAGLSGDAYRLARAQAAFALEALNKIVPAEVVDGLDWRWLASQVDQSPKNFLAAASQLREGRRAAVPNSNPTDASLQNFPALIEKAATGKVFPRVITWTLIDTRRVTLIPPGHWLLVEDSAPFRATLEIDGTVPMHVQSIPAGNVHVACFAPRETAADAQLSLERHAATSQKISASIRFLAPEPVEPSTLNYQPSTLVLLTNNRGGMARLCVDLGRVNSKYDCALGANLDPSVPVDRHVFVKRIRVWVNANGFLSPLDFKSLASFHYDSGATWDFVANAGDGRTVEICLHAEMVEDENTVVFQFSRPTEKLAQGKQLPADADVRLTVRVDIEDRNFHSETKRNGGADYHFASNTREIKNGTGFEFTPTGDRQLHAYSSAGEFHPQPEWCENIPHPVELTRGQTGSGDAYSPGWFELPVTKGAQLSLTLTAEPAKTTSTEAQLAAPKPGEGGNPKSDLPRRSQAEAGIRNFEPRLVAAAKQFVVRRDDFKTVIAGYPWFLDWGRDSLICARGLLAAGLTDEVRQILVTFAKFEKDGTLPNTIHGNDVSNRDTSDAPLWFAVACEDLDDRKFFDKPVDENGRTIRDVLTSIAENYARGTPNGIHMDFDSALIWSPSHFTWMDTNYPAGTPREGYPVEIQALWIRLLRLLEKISPQAGQKKWQNLADHATASFEKLFWLEQQGWFADVLLGKSNVIARDATPSDALRNNCLLAISLGLITGEHAKRCVAAAEKYLVVPGGLRTLAPLPVKTPLPVSRDGQIINNPTEPYWPQYEGDEDTRRKPAYHNGTAWTWTFPAFCEALVRAWDGAPEAVATAKSYLGSAEKLLDEGCLGQLPEILDGDAPHVQRGCDAQAWGVTETLRVWKWLNSTVAQSK